MWTNFCKWLLGAFGWTIHIEDPGAEAYVLIVAPHTSNWDFLIGILAAQAIGLEAHWIGKHTLLFDRSDLDQQTVREDSEDLDEKTRYLDTAEYRELIEKAKKDPKDGPSYVGTAVSRDFSTGFFTRIWRRLFG